MQEKTLDISPELQQIIQSELAWYYRIIPKSESKESFSFFVDSSMDLNFIEEELSALLGKRVIFEECSEDIIQRSLGKYYRNTTVENDKITFDSDVDFVDRLIQEANVLGSSDIHVEIFDKAARIRIRIDGNLIHRFTIEKEDYPELVNKIKIKANLDISEKRLPQDGRIEYEKFDIRVSILPTLHGEKIVLRILGNDASSIDIEKIGFSEKEKKTIKRVFENQMELF